MDLTLKTCIGAQRHTWIASSGVPECKNCVYRIQGTSNNAGSTRDGNQGGSIVCSVRFAASAAPFYLPTRPFQTRIPASCGGDPLQRHKAANVVGQVLQANLRARSHDANRTHDPAAQRGLLSSEYVLDAGPNFASVVVRIRLRLRQRALASCPHMNTALEAASAQSLLNLVR